MRELSIRRANKKAGPKKGKSLVARPFYNLGTGVRRIFDYVIRKSWGELHAFFDNILKSSAAKNTVKSQLNEYRSWVHIATSVIYRRVSEVDYKFFRKDTEEEIKPGNRVYKIVKNIFDEPNPFMDFRFLKAFTQLQLDLTGKAFILRIDDGLGLPLQLWPLMVDDFKQLEKGTGYGGWITGFTFNIDGKYRTYKPENILYFHYPNPKDPRDGMSPIQSQAYAIDVDHYIEVYERDFFRNSARPDFLIKYPPEVTIADEDEAQRIKEQWQKSFRGEGNYHNIGILDSGGDIIQLTPKNKDLDLMFLANWSQEKILAAYNVPPGKVGMVKDVNRANAIGIDITFNCYSEDTEFLTDLGWKGIDDYEIGDKIATVVPESNKIEYHLPIRKFEVSYKGRLTHFKTKQIDMLVTPNHRMWYSRQTGAHPNGKWKTIFTPWSFEKAANLMFNNNGIGATRTYVINQPVTFDNGNEIDNVIVREIPRNRGVGGNSFQYSQEGESYIIDGDLWFEFLGYFLSGGATSDLKFKGKHAVSINQKVDNVRKIRQCLNKLPFYFGAYIERKDGRGEQLKLGAFNKTLWTYLKRQCGDKCDSKKIPSIVMNACARQKDIFFNAMLFGDGTKNRLDKDSRLKNPFMRERSAKYSSITVTSAVMIEQLGRIALELGYKVSYGPPWKTVVDKTAYRINLTRWHRSSIRAKQITEVEYDGKVWCFTVPNGLFITRRKGKVAVQGNSEAILPRLQMMDSVFTRGVTKLFDDRIYIKHNNPIPRDRELDIKEIEKKVGVPIWTPNEGRAKEGLPAVEGGDTIQVPLNFMPLSAVPDITMPDDEDETGGGGSPDDEIEGETRALAEQKEFTYTEEYRVKRWHAFKIFTESWEGIWRTALRGLFMEQQEEVLERLEKQVEALKGKSLEFEKTWDRALAKYNGWSYQKVADDLMADQVFFDDLCVFGYEKDFLEIVIRHLLKGSIVESVLADLDSFIVQKQRAAIEASLFDWDGNVRQFSLTARRLTREVMREAGSEELSMLGIDLDFNLENDLSREFLGEKVREFSRNVLSTKADQLRRALSAGFGEGESTAQLTERVRDVYRSVLMGGSDAMRIARTEVISASNAGSHLAYEQSRVVEEKEWLSTKDQRTRGADPKDAADHLHMDGQRVPLDMPFVDRRTGARLMQPGDTSLGAGGEDVIRCRCAVLPHTTRSKKYREGPGIRELQTFQRKHGLQGTHLSRIRRQMRRCY